MPGTNDVDPDRDLHRFWSNETRKKKMTQQQCKKVQKFHLCKPLPYHPITSISPNLKNFPINDKSLITNTAVFLIRINRIRIQSGQWIRIRNTDPEKKDLTLTRYRYRPITISGSKDKNALFMETGEIGENP
jgi:hypothetical protein